MTYPIYVIYFPENYSLFASGRELQPFELMKELNGWNREGKHEQDDDRFGGYMYWCFPKSGIDAPEFKVFHTKDFTEVEFAELKQLVMTEINTIAHVSTTGE